MCAHVHVCIFMCEGYRLMSLMSINFSIPYLLREGLLLNPELKHWGGLNSQVVPGDLTPED